MNKIIWKDNEDIVAGTTLRDVQVKEDNNMALHVGGNLTDVIANRQGLSEDLDISLNQWVFAQQTHSDHMHEVTKADAGKGSLLYVIVMLYIQKKVILPLVFFMPTVYRCCCMIHSPT